MLLLVLISTQYLSFLCCLNRVFVQIQSFLWWCLLLHYGQIWQKIPSKDFCNYLCFFLNNIYYFCIVWIGTLWTASAHIITGIIGSGVLSLAWGVAQLGWIAGVATLVVFSGITLYTSSLLTDCYRSPVTGKRNYTYKEVVKNNLGSSSEWSKYSSFVLCVESFFLSWGLVCMKSQVEGCILLVLLFNMSTWLEWWLDIPSRPRLAWRKCAGELV